jgi:N-dimethylarginine dimethylaminohydrolase
MKTILPRKEPDISTIRSPQVLSIRTFGGQLDRLREQRIEAIHCPPGEEWAINSLCLRPGRVLMCDGYPRARQALERRGVEVVAIPYDEIQKAGGGIHCSTMELVRDPAG